jgi:tetratricopeptide (TPR) repeat protein
MTQFERTGNPFPGLRPFETEEYNLFFGREGQADELLARLGRTRFLAVVGTSGSGKSSLIRAGLMPALYGGLMGATGSAWRIAVMRPGHNPLGNLAAALSEDDVIGSPDVDDDVEATIIETTLRRSTLGLVDAVRQARLPAYENVLVVVDQFEELFRFRSMREQQQGTDDDAAAFVKLLLEAPQQRDVSIYVVLTMRSDFLGDCSQFQGLPEAINDGQYLIPRMTRDERRSAITGPAAVGGGEISPPLVNRLLNDVGDNPDQLPILQHALMRTWDYWAEQRRDSEPVGLPHYEAVGTMTDALSKHADEAFNELPDERSHHIAEILFKALTERGVDNREIRRPTRLKEICEIAGASEAEVAAVIEVFRREGRSFLMPPAGVALTPETIIDISHESLIRNWGRLKDWVKDEAEAARIYRRLAVAATDYREGVGGLLDDVTLQWVLKWRDKYSPSHAWGVRYHPEYDNAIAFLDESTQARAAAAKEREQQRLELLQRERRERAQAERHADEQARAARRLRALVVAMAALFGLALVAFGFAFNAKKRVEQAREKLQLNRRALTLIQSYEMEEAEKLLTQLYGLTLDDAEGRENKAWVLYNLGEINYKLERYDEAAAFFESALQTEVMVHGKLGLDSVGTLDRLAHTLEAAHNYPSAVARYEQLADILGSVADQKDRYFKLNTANVHNDLASLYVAQSFAVSPEVDANTRRKTWQESMKAIGIWEDVLKNDPQALDEKYQESLDRLYNRVFTGAPQAEYRKLYEPTLEEIRSHREHLLSNIKTPRERKPIGQLNPGNDPGISTQLPTEGTGYTTFNRDPAGLYGRPATVAFVRAVCAAWAARHPELKLVVGDISTQGGGPFPPHLDHQDGREVDIWALANSGVSEPTNIYAPNYSRTLTTELINLIQQTNPNAVIYFDDPPLVTAGLVKGTLDHNNYMHVLLP